MTLRINIWSSPRNISTALMYSWRQRSDSSVVDEPLYAHYLRVTGLDHPGREAILASQDSDGDAVVRDLMLGPWDKPVVLFKQMAKHLVSLDRGFLDQCTNVLLTRDPREMLLSFSKVVPDATLAETGFTEMVEILDASLAAGNPPIVVDAGGLLRDPVHVLVELCSRLGLSYDDAMMSWPAGPKPEDGVWAPHWYASVHESTTWSPWTRRTGELSTELTSVLAEALPLYRRLQEYAIT